MSLELLAVLLLILAAECVNGWTDAPNAIATVVGTRALSPRGALALAAVFNLLGVLSGTAVAATIGKDIIDPRAVTLTTVGGAMVGIVVWSSIAALGDPDQREPCARSGLGRSGPGVGGPLRPRLDGGAEGLDRPNVFQPLGVRRGGSVMLAIYWLCRRAIPGKVQRVFRWLQIASAAFMAFSHGSNDGQKFMGALTLALVLAGVLPTFVIPLWVVGLCALVMALGTSIGGWRIMRTLGMRLTNLKTHQGFAAEPAAAGTITVASALGIPLSTTHTIATAIMGVGAVHGVRAVRWGLTQELVMAWVLTFPICAALSWGGHAAALHTVTGRRHTSARFDTPTNC
jgi:inorganic phosphate transporter, PiT family